MKKLLLLIIFLSIGFFANALTVETVDGKKVVQNQNITEKITIDGSQYDGAIIRNCVLHDQAGVGITLRNVKDVLIEGNEFYGQTQAAILLSDIGGADNITIRDNYFHDLPNHGIHAQEKNTGTKVVGNTFIHCAYVPNASAKPHPVYLKSKDFLIEKNEIDGSSAHGISVRNSGIVRRNTVLNVTEAGIRYFNDASENIGESLRIEANTIENCPIGISLLKTASFGQIQKTWIRYNTIKNCEYPIHVSAGFQGNIIIKIYWNKLYN